MSFPIGSIILWSNETVPAGYHICDGTGGTPDLRNRFICGATDGSDLLTTGGVDSHSHTNPSTSTYSSHTHSFSGNTGGANDYEQTALGGSSTAVLQSHTHSFSGTTSSNGSHYHTVPNTSIASNLPPYIKLYYIMRIE